MNHGQTCMSLFTRTIFGVVRGILRCVLVSVTLFHILDLSRTFDRYPWEFSTYTIVGRAVNVCRWCNNSKLTQASSTVPTTKHVTLRGIPVHGTAAAVMAALVPKELWLPFGPYFWFSRMCTALFYCSPSIHEQRVFPVRHAFTRNTLPLYFLHHHRSCLRFQVQKNARARWHSYAVPASSPPLPCVRFQM